jgi:hypothetical protein
VAACKLLPRPDHVTQAPLPLRHEIAMQEAAMRVEQTTITINECSATYTPCTTIQSVQRREEALLRRALVAASATGTAALHSNSRLDRSFDASVAVRSASVPPSLGALEDRDDTSVPRASSVLAVATKKSPLPSNAGGAAVKATVIVKNEAVMQTANEQAKAGYQRSVRTTKSKLESGGTLVVIVGGGMS